jgi:phosphonate transport system substrate-binding protein
MKTRTTILKWLACLYVIGAALSAPAARADPLPLRLAVHPYASTLALVTTYRSVQQYLAKALGRPVEFYTAPNFDGFVDSLMAGEYDIAISPPHFAMMAMATHYVPLLHYQTRLEPLLVVPIDSPIHSGKDFRGKRIAMADRSAFIRLVTVKWLADRGLTADKDYRIVERPNHGAAISAAVMGEVDAGLATITALRQLPLDVQHKVRTIGTGLRFPHLFTLANRRLGTAEIERLRKALRAFPETAEGRRFMEKSAFGGYEDISQEEIDSLRPYVDLYRQLEAR